jgi:hypothetical protein
MLQLVKRKRQANFKDLKPSRGSSNNKILYSTRSCKLGFFGTRGPLRRNSLNKLLL